jgi:hypothetical protein
VPHRDHDRPDRRHRLWTHLPLKRRAYPDSFERQPSVAYNRFWRRFIELQRTASI